MLKLNFYTFGETKLGRDAGGLDHHTIAPSRDSEFHICFHDI